MSGIYTVEYEDEFLAISKPLGRIMREIFDLQKETGCALQESKHDIATRLRNMPVKHTEFVGLGARHVLVHREN